MRFRAALSCACLSLLFSQIQATAGVRAVEGHTSERGERDLLLAAACPRGMRPGLFNTGNPAETQAGCVPIITEQVKPAPKDVTSTPPPVDDWLDCAGTEPDRSIIACTRIIDSGGGYIDPKSIPQILRSRDHGPWIEALQSFLVSQGYDVGIIDGVYGAATQRALLAFQKGQGSRVSIKDILVRAWQGRNLAYAHYNRGLAYFNKGDYDRAIADYDQAIPFEPDDAYAYSNRGLAYLWKGDYDRAIADYDRAIRLKPDFAGAYSYRGSAYGRKGDYDRAIADLDQAIRLKPDDALAFNNRGLAYFNKGDHDRAIADYDQAIRLKPDYDYAYYNRGLAYDRKADAAKALVDFRIAASLIQSDDPWKDKALQRIAEIETKLARPATTPAPSKPASSPETFTAGGIVVGVFLAQVDGQRITRITVEGDLKPGDEKVFRNALLTVDADDFPIVFLNSPGGDLQAGIEIGNTIWINEFVTVVADDAICASACALAWLAGRPRYVEHHPAATVADFSTAVLTATATLIRRWP